MSKNSIVPLFAGRNGYLLGFIACFGLVGLALVIQTHYHLEPCPLCITQRMFFMALGILFLLSVFLKRKSHLHKVFTSLQVLTAIGGAGWAARHWYIQAHKESMIVDCGVGFDYMFENFPLEKALSLVFKGTGDCADIDWVFLGLSLPQLALVAFVLFGLFAIWLYKGNTVGR